MISLSEYKKTCFKKSDFSFLIFFWFLSFAFLNHYIVFVIDVLIFIFFLIKNKGKLRTFSGFTFFLLYFTFGSVFGLIHYAYSEVLLSDYIRDILYFANPFLMFLICSYIYKEYSFTKIINSLLLYFFIYCIYALFKLGTTLLSGNFNISEHTADWNLYAFLAMLLSKNIRNQVTLFKKLIPILIVLDLTIMLFSFSRTSLIVFFISFIVLCVNKKNYVSFLYKILGFSFLIFTVLFVLYLNVPTFKNTMTIFLEKLMNSFTEIGSNNTWDKTTISTNWRGYEINQGLIEFSNGNIIEKFLGYGFGKGINMGRYSFLVVQNRNDSLIPVLHNGYITMLVKFGIFGLTLYIGFYLNLICKCYLMIKKGYWNYRLGLAFTLVYIVSTYFVMGLFYSGNSYLLLFFMAYYANYDKNFKFKLISKTKNNLLNSLSY